MSVKQKKRGRPTGKTNQLSKERIITQAKILMIKDTKIPSIRKLATALEVDAMAIYHYFSNKASLLEAITVSLIEAIYQPQESNDWQHELKLLCQSYLTLLKDHGGLMETMLSMSSNGPAQVFSTRFETALNPLSLTQQDKQDGLELLVDYLHGLALAMHYNTQLGQLTIKQLNGPLSFYMVALKAKASSQD